MSPRAVNSGIRWLVSPLQHCSYVRRRQYAAFALDDVVSAKGAWLRWQTLPPSLLLNNDFQKLSLAQFRVYTLVLCARLALTGVFELQSSRVSSPRSQLASSFIQRSINQLLQRRRAIAAQRNAEQTEEGRRKQRTATW